MKRNLLLLLLLCVGYTVWSQKKLLDHSVYDSWQSLDEKIIAADGQWVAYSVNPQEGDGVMYVKSFDGLQKLIIPRGYGAQFSPDSRFLYCKIKPRYADVRAARIKKRTADEMPKDSFAVFSIADEKLWKTATVKTFKQPEQESPWIAILKERPATPRAVAAATAKTVDSLKRTIDSLQQVLRTVKNVKAGPADADEEPATSGATSGGGDLWLRNVQTGNNKIFKWVAEYLFNANGTELVLRTVRSAADTGSMNAVLLHHLNTGKTDTLAKGGNEFKTLAVTEDGRKVSFLAQRDTIKTGVKTWGVYVYQGGDDSARLWIDKGTAGMQVGNTVSENSNLQFSKLGNRLFFGTAALPVPRDTSLIDIDAVKVDVWHYNDDYLQSQQLYNLQTELRRNYTAVYQFEGKNFVQLADKNLPYLLPTGTGDGVAFYAATDTGRRVATQWMGAAARDVYSINPQTGLKTLIKAKHTGAVFPSSTGKFLLLYDAKSKGYQLWNGKELKNITAGIKAKFYNEENDVPADPPPYGIMGWHDNDSAVYVYDRYNIWRIFTTDNSAPQTLIKNAAPGISYRYVVVDTTLKAFSTTSVVPLRLFNNNTKTAGWVLYHFGNGALQPLQATGNYALRSIAKAKHNDRYIISQESFELSPSLWSVTAGTAPKQIGTTNAQQAGYNWGTASLYHWTTFDGKKASGILYKPEDFSPTKKYPVLFYFYEKLSDDLYNYLPPAPTPSRLNIPFFVSRGYLVLAPDISYGTGHPGKDAYNYIVSGAKSLTAKPWVDGKNMGIQGQSWGGYQVAYLITATNMFKAAWAGAPVVNMTSAYGGIRWESGVNRQFQYEKGQSRIAASLWQRPDLYMENSPLFQLPKVQTPVVIMANDADGAVPWYQGIEMFTALRRLGKPVWMLNYNGEAHNLVERKNRKDIQIREQQFFDWMLKGAKPAKWLVSGVPATEKGKQWGLEVVDE